MILCRSVILYLHVLPVVGPEVVEAAIIPAPVSVWFPLMKGNELKMRYPMSFSGNYQAGLMMQEYLLPGTNNSSGWAERRASRPIYTSKPGPGQLERYDP